MKVVSKNLSPLCYLTNGEVVCYSEGYIVCGLHNGKRYKINNSIKYKIIEKSKLLSRICRAGIRSAIAINDNEICFSIRNRICELDLSNGSLSEGYVCSNSSRPLNFTCVKDIKGFDDAVYWGEYMYNPLKKAISIYKRINKDTWFPTYEFKEGLINHIHNIVADPYRDCLWIFTGDFGEASAIWKVTDNFKRVERVAFNSQKFRGCVAFVTEEGLIYATDTPFENNYIYKFNTKTYELNTLSSISGSCIYGCKWIDKYVFSTAVEGDGRELSLIDFLFSKKKGSGIKDDYAHLYVGDCKNGFKEIYKERKDIYPFYLCQFGVFKFPAGNNNNDELLFQPVATCENDQSLLSIHRNIINE